MRLADQYDVICAGSGLSSYLCAALLAKAGKRVLVIDDEDQALARVLEKNPLFDPDFALFGGLDETAALGKSLGELGLLLDKEGKPAFHFYPEVTQVLTADHRIVFHKDGTETCREVRRELKGSSDAVCDFFSTIYESGKTVSSFVENVLNPGQTGAAEASAWKKFWGPYFKVINQPAPVALRDVLTGKTRRFANIYRRQC